VGTGDNIPVRIGNTTVMPGDVVFGCTARPRDAASIKEYDDYL
jgi:hypothetical protein